MIDLLRRSYCAKRSQRNMQGGMHVPAELGGRAVRIGSDHCDCIPRRSSALPHLRWRAEIRHLRRNIVTRKMGISKQTGAWFKHNLLPVDLVPLLPFAALKNTDHACQLP